MDIINRQLCYVCLFAVILLCICTATSHPYNDTISPGLNTGGEKNVLQLSHQFGDQWPDELQTQDSLTGWLIFVRRQRRNSDFDPLENHDNASEPEEDTDPAADNTRKPSGSPMLNVNMHFTMSCTLCVFIFFIVLRFC
ncbi:hypothetical protein BsWGS_10123 [Bradybaena similaris]